MIEQLHVLLDAACYRARTAEVTKGPHAERIARELEYHLRAALNAAENYERAVG